MHREQPKNCATRQKSEVTVGQLCIKGYLLSAPLHRVPTLLYAITEYQANCASQYATSVIFLFDLLKGGSRYVTNALAEELVGEFGTAFWPANLMD